MCLWAVSWCFHPGGAFIQVAAHSSELEEIFFGAFGRVAPVHMYPLTPHVCPRFHALHPFHHFTMSAQLMCIWILLCKHFFLEDTRQEKTKWSLHIA